MELKFCQLSGSVQFPLLRPPQKATELTELFKRIEQILEKEPNLGNGQCEAIVLNMKYGWRSTVNPEHKIGAFSLVYLLVLVQIVYDFGINKKL